MGTQLAIEPKFMREARKPAMTELTPQHQEAIRRILEGATNREISDELGVNYETVLRWRRGKLFARALSREAKRVADTSLALLRANVTHATQRLIEMIDEEKPSQTKFNAAMAVIKIVYENQMLEDIQAQVKELEAAGTREP